MVFFDQLLIGPLLRGTGARSGLLDSAGKEVAGDHTCIIKAKASMSSKMKVSAAAVVVLFCRRSALIISCFWSDDVFAMSPLRIRSFLVFGLAMCILRIRCSSIPGPAMCILRIRFSSILGSTMGKDVNARALSASTRSTTPPLFDPWSVNKFLVLVALDG